MRSRARRRSTSSFVSPGPRPPMPPARRDISTPEPVRRGSTYLSCASSTWILPSRLCARWAKMSRMSCDRSTTLRSVAELIDRTCAGERSRSKMIMSTPSCVACTSSSLSLPLPTSVRGSSCERRWISLSSTTTLDERASSASSSSDSSASATAPVVTLTRIARSRRSEAERTSRVRANSASSSSIISRKSSSIWLGWRGSMSTHGSEVFPGARCAAWTTAGSPSASSVTAATRSRRSSARSVRSSCVSFSPRRCVCRRRTPRRRDAPARARLISGISIDEASPTITEST